MSYKIVNEIALYNFINLKSSQKRRVGCPVQQPPDAHQRTGTSSAEQFAQYYLTQSADKVHASFLHYTTVAVDLIYSLLIRKKR